MVNFLTLTCIFATWAVAVVSSAAQNAPSHPPVGSPGTAPAAADCSTLIYDMMDCMEFLIIGGTETTPQDSCCSGFRTVLKANADCICYALSNSASLGLDVNMTRAEALPSDCGVSAPPISNCYVSTSPGGSPAYPPTVSAPPLNYPTLPPTTQPPTATPAVGGAPAVAPSGIASVPASQAAAPSPHRLSSIASVPDSQAAAPSPKKSVACTISATYSALLFVIISFLLFNA